jgi:hypothetical protein
MNSTLRKSIYKKKMMLNRYLDRNNVNWKKYRQSRNLVTKIKKQSIKNYFWTDALEDENFLEDCKTFFKKHFVLNDVLLSDQEAISNVLNDFYINVAKNIGDSNVLCNDSHVSVSKIKETTHLSDELIFKHVSVNCVKE